MNDLLSALVLGIIEGITEFLPISSTGHLLIAERWLGARSDLFNIAIQAGAILAIVLIYRQRLWQLLVGLRQHDNRDYVLKLALAFAVTAVLGLLAKKLGVKLPETIGPVAWALLVGGFVMLGAEAAAARRAHVADDSPAAIGWSVAILVGIAQVVAGIFPGTSRSAAAIFAAILFGRGGRVAATEFAFLVGIPTMFAATGYELLHTLKDGGAASEDWSALGVAFVVSALTAFAAVKWLLRYIQTHRFTVFSWYRIALGAALLVWLQAGAAAAAHATEMRAPEAVAVAGSASTPTAPNGQQRSAGVAAPPHAERQELLAHWRQRFEHLHLCSRASLLKDWKPDAERLKADLASEYPGIVAMARRELAWQGEMAAWMPAVLERASRECVGEDFSPRALADTALQAANLGDFAAAECYLVLAPNEYYADVSRPPLTPAELAEHADYVANARRLIARGIAAGDWRMVSQAASSANPRNAAGVDDRSDPTLAYRMYRLLQRGLSEAGKRDSMARSADFEQQHLSAAQIRSSDAWVDQHYRRDFAGKPLMDYGVMCPFPGEPAFPVG